MKKLTILMLWSIFIMSRDIKGKPEPLIPFFTGKNTHEYNDTYPRVRIIRLTFYQLIVQAAKDQKLSQEPLQQLIQKIRNRELDEHDEHYYITVTDKDAYHRLLQYIPDLKEKRRDQSLNSVTYTASINDRCADLEFRFSEVVGPLPPDDRGIATNITSSYFSQEDPAITAQYKTLVWGSQETKHTALLTRVMKQRSKEYV